MAFCIKCGNQLTVGARFCSKCGAPVTAQPNENVWTMRKGVFGKEKEQSIKNHDGVQPFNMGWHKFLIYFALFVNALFLIFYGGQFMTGAVYGEAVEQVYNYYGSGLKTLDTLVGLLYFVLGAFCVYTRFQLAKFKRNAPKMLVAIYIANVFITVIYLLFLETITEVSIADNMSSLVSSIALIIINIKYYKKRESLFVN